MVTTRFCDCEQDGFCPRYQREMRGRFRDICRGLDVDLGTAAVYRHQWARESVLPPVDGVPVPLLLRADQMPGDVVAMTAAVYSLHRSHPGKYITSVESSYPDVFAYNPDVVPSRAGAAVVQMHYPAVHQSNERGVHFMHAWCSFLGVALGINLPLLTDRPHLYFPDPDPPIGDFWLICSGGKRDFTTKLWGHVSYQKVVDTLGGVVKFVQVGNGVDNHPRLGGVDCVVGKTTLRDLFELVRRARGVLCGVSLLMHVAAALEKPSVVIAGGREPVSWNVYPKMRYLHTVGSLPCRSTQGHTNRACWRSRVVPLGDGSWYDKDTCERPVNGLAECMRLITPHYVVETIMQVENGYACIKEN